jgi:hypothetical protein
MHTYSVRGAPVLHASTFDANIMIMIIICSRAAWYTVYVGAARDRARRHTHNRDGDEAHHAAICKAKKGDG